ncbi:hypothetical protein VZT92_021752 [Zoarces viviparus]|uniref:Uncharacterized protein n=1 Tax=Zoarces viviparus TaxID=48416 RepID=A0AAW1EA11_ZOAVI
MAQTAEGYLVSSNRSESLHQPVGLMCTVSEKSPTVHRELNGLKMTFTSCQLTLPMARSSCCLTAASSPDQQPQTHSYEYSRCINAG